MHYPYTLTIPANTPIATPVREEVQLTDGVIVQVGYFFIPDCAGYVGARIRHRDTVIWPSGKDRWYVRNEGGEFWPEDYPLTESPYFLTLEGYNLDDSYDHDVEFSFAVQPQTSILRRVFGKLLGPPKKAEGV